MNRSSGSIKRNSKNQWQWRSRWWRWWGRQESWLGCPASGLLSSTITRERMVLLLGNSWISHWSVTAYNPALPGSSFPRWWRSFAWKKEKTLWRSAAPSMREPTAWLERVWRERRKRGGSWRGWRTGLGVLGAMLGTSWRIWRTSKKHLMLGAAHTGVQSSNSIKITIQILIIKITTVILYNDHDQNLQSADHQKIQVRSKRL